VATTGKVDAARAAVMGGSYGGYMTFAELSPITHVRNVRAPLMVIHGANDPRDPVSEADQMVDATRRRGGEVEYLRLPDEGHGIRKLANRITAYLERTLGTARHAS
jgi:dipeptidyl aminopeptidase/acylaminoacyl peptidase